VWTWIVWAALAVGTVTWTAAAARTGVAALRLWRDVKRARRRLFGELDALAAAAETAADRAAAAGAESERLTRGLARLAVSRRQLGVLQQALGEAQDVVGGVTAVYPRK